MNMYYPTLFVKYAGNPKPTLQCLDENGLLINYEHMTRYQKNRFSAKIRFEFSKPETFTLIAKNKKNITIQKEIHMHSEGNFNKFLNIIYLTRLFIVLFSVTPMVSSITDISPRNYKITYMK